MMSYIPPPIDQVDFELGLLFPSLEEIIQAIKAKTDTLPTEPELAAVHGVGSWEGATPTQLWTHDDRRLTSRAIDSAEPEEYLPSEEQVQTLEAILDLIKGLGFESEKDALRVIRELVESAIPKATFKI